MVLHGLYLRIADHTSSARTARLLDVVVDGPFIQKLRDPDLLFRGSSNQRLIDVQASLYAGEVILWKPDVDVTVSSL